MNTKVFDRTLRKVPGIVVATVEGDQVDVAALGSLSNEPEPRTLVWEIGSITKVFTGLLLAEMSVKGEVKLDDPIGLHAPVEVAERLPDPERQPTLADLAAHTAGLPRIPRQWLRRLKGEADPYSKLTEQDVWDVLGSDTLRPRRPRHRYSNYGAGLLGQLLGRAADSTYEELVAERILGPLEMSNSGFETQPVQGYRKGKPTPPWTFSALAGAGALRSTVDDMIRFARACVFPPQGALGGAFRLARQPITGRIRQVGLGWMIRRRPGRPGEALWHNGGTFATSSFLAVDDKQARAVISFGNAGPRLVPPLDSPSWKIFDTLG